MASCLLPNVSTVVRTQPVLKCANRRKWDKMGKCQREEGVSGWLPWYLSSAVLHKYHWGSLCFWSNSSRRVLLLPLHILADEHLAGETHQPPEKRDPSTQSDTFTNWYSAQYMTAWWNAGSHYPRVPFCETTGSPWNIHKTYHFHLFLKGWCQILSQLIKSRQICMEFVNVISLALCIKPYFFLLPLNKTSPAIKRTNNDACPTVRNSHAGRIHSSWNTSINNMNEYVKVTWKHLVIQAI